MSASDALQVRLDARAPHVAQGAWAAPGTVLAGEVHLETDSSVWYGTVARADGDQISVGTGSNIQDGCVLHADPGLPVRIGDRVTIGHRVVLHGCTVDDDVLIGMGAVVLNGARIRTGSLVAAGAVVLEGTDFPPNSLIAGMPAKVRRETTEQERLGISKNAAAYVELMRWHSRAETSPLSGATDAAGKP